MAVVGVGCNGESICSKHVTMLMTIIMSFGVISCCLGHGGGDHDGHLGAEGGSCIESERRALLAIRSDMYDSGKRFSSWIGEDCCSWRGVACDDNTSHVIKLDLHYLHTHNFYTYDLDDEDDMCFMLEGMGASKEEFQQPVVKCRPSLTTRQSMMVINTFVVRHCQSVLVMQLIKVHLMQQMNRKRKMMTGLKQCGKLPASSWVLSLVFGVL
uniref:Leucine-rich repeat-containing N-terminal plant-type domain-containing protein n=1 Tax=Musa acuminata subsp. malaccensis TaxID=214687 RepID=A0A804KMK1_MUSAM